jgi:hypothetical protein
MSMPYERIQNHSHVLEAFGYWPSFHDAEVRSLVLDRNTTLFEGIADAQIEVCLHALEWTREAHPAYNHHLVQFRFHEVDEVKLNGFNHQNAILEFRIENLAEMGLKVTFVPAHGLSGSFRAGRAEVVSVVPCTQDGRTRQKSEPVASPNGGPAEPSTKPGVSGGPPSVS